MNGNVKDDDATGRSGGTGAGRRASTGPASFGSVGELLRETADGLGGLIIQHLKLAQLELTAELRAMGSRAALLGVYVVLMVVGYMLTMTGVALLVGGHGRVGWSFVGLGLLHVVGTAIGMWVAFRHGGHRRLFENTADELNQSATTLIAAGRPPAPSVSVARTALEPVNGR
jgi:uncharacterized membrane protein YqjE